MFSARVGNSVSEVSVFVSPYAGNAEKIRHIPTKKAIKFFEHCFFITNPSSNKPYTIIIFYVKN